MNGLKGVIRELRKVMPEKQAEARRSLEQIGQDLESKSVNLAPLDEDTLRSSANSHVDDLSVFVIYNTPYALRMHEDLEYTPQHSGTGPKYLTKPLRENEAKYFRKLFADLVVKQ